MTMRTKRAIVKVTEEEDDLNTDDDIQQESASEDEREITQEESDNENAASSGEDNENSDQEEDGLANTGWADLISKILKTNKPKGKKTVVLSKAKKITDVEKTKVKDVGFEVEAMDGQVTREHTEESDEDDETKKPLRKRKKDLRVYRVKPDILKKDRERLLSKIATRGVVQLFNAVKNQQKDIDTKLKDAGPLEVKRDKVLKNIDKREFLNVLMGGTTNKSEANQFKKESKSALKNESNDKEPTWKVLRDDFMMSAKMKDWDKELEDEDVEMKDENSDST